MRRLKNLFILGLFVSLSFVQQSEAQRVLTFLTPPAAVDNTCQCYLIFGQSNTSKPADVTGLDSQYLGPQATRIYTTYGSGTNTRNASTQSWQFLELGKNHNNEGVNGVADPTLFGPEMSFGRLMSATGKKICFLKVAYSSSSMLGQGSVNDWKIGGPGTNYANFMQNSVLPGLTEIVTDLGLTPIIRGALWYQGEAERDGVVGYATATDLQNGYILQCTRLMQWVIDDLNEAGWDTKNMRIAFGRVSPRVVSPPSPASVAAIRAAQVYLATNFRSDNTGYQQYCAGTTYIDTDGFAVSAVDGIHLLQSGALDLGSAYYDYFSPYLNENVTITYANTTGYDTDAAAHVTAAKLTSQTAADGINAYVIASKSNGDWAGSTAIYPLMGGNRKAHKLNLKDPTNLLGYNLTFNTSVNHTSLGFNGNTNGGFPSTNAPGGYASTNIPFNALGQNTAGLAYYTPTAIQEAVYGMGVVSAAGTARMYATASWTDNKLYHSDMSSEGSFTNTTGNGFFMNTRTSSSNYNVFWNGTKTAVTSTSAAPDANIFYIGARNNNGSIGSISAKTWSFFQLLNTSMNDTQAGNMRTNATTLQGVR